MAVWWCCMCGVETRRASEMVCADCKAKVGHSVGVVEQLGLFEETHA